MQLMHLLAVTAASRSIELSASYFVPDALTLQALVEAMKRGVRLRIVVPGKHIDSETVRKASRATWGPLLAAGAVIAEYGPTMYHCKVMIVDGMLVSVGSTNFDNRSFMKTNGQQGMVLNVVVGLVGALLAGLLISPMVGVGTINQSNFSLPALIVSFVGAVVLLAIVNIFRRGSAR
ncbi:hypothetical protein GCM10023089_13790 [Quisquiliibacterium transsilvanicum]